MIPWLRPVNLRDAFIKDQKALAADISLKRTALQAVLDRDEDGGGTMVRSAIKSCWRTAPTKLLSLLIQVVLLEKKLEDRPMQLAVFETITNHHPYLLMLSWICGSFSHSSGALFHLELPHVTLTTSQQKNSPKATAGPSSLESLVQTEM